MQSSAGQSAAALRGTPHGRLQVVGELPVAGAFVADRLDWLVLRWRLSWSRGLLRSLVRQTVTRGCRAAGPRRSRAGPGRRWCVPRSAWSGRPGRSSHRVVRGRCGRPRFTWTYPRMVGHRSRRDREEAGFGGAVPNQAPPPRRRGRACQRFRCSWSRSPPARDGTCRSRVRLGCWRFRGRRVVPPGPDPAGSNHFHPGSGPVTPMLTVLGSKGVVEPVDTEFNARL